jgi:hypothetical protein
MTGSTLPLQDSYSSGQAPRQRGQAASGSLTSWMNKQLGFVPHVRTIGKFSHALCPQYCSARIIGVGYRNSLSRRERVRVRECNKKSSTFSPSSCPSPGGRRNPLAHPHKKCRTLLLCSHLVAAQHFARQRPCTPLSLERDDTIDDGKVIAIRFLHPSPVVVR